MGKSFLSRNTLIVTVVPISDGRNHTTGMWGLDFGIMNGRIDGSVEWFKTTTKGLLFKRTLPITSGLTGWGSPLAIWQNIAQTSNQGVEATITSHNIRHKDFTWNTTLSVTWNKEQIDDLPDGDLIAENLFGR